MRPSQTPPTDLVTPQVISNTPADQRAKQVLGRMGDFFGLVDLFANLEKAKPFIDEARVALADLGAMLVEQRKLAAQIAEREIALAAGSLDLQIYRDRDAAKLAKATAAIQSREDVVAGREADCNTREQAIATRENGVTAREAKLTKDNAEALASLAETRVELQELADQLSIRKADLETQQATFERRFQAAKAILAAVPDGVATTQGGDSVGRDQATAYTR